MKTLSFPRKVELADITVRDGFQHEEKWIPTAAKLWIAEELVLAGYRRIEVTNLGNPKGMPQFADADTLLKEIRTSKRIAKHAAGLELTAITIRERAVDRAIALKKEGVGPDRILMMGSTSASHMKKNSGLDH
ncbi:MAG TPA: pyruvate carboxyltransferase, partial [Thermoanaerobaculia bacterium]|nr:pyruvate carboxyltransferase [Thermoanaerobaculia bacterium]